MSFEKGAAGECVRLAYEDRDAENVLISPLTVEQMEILLACPLPLEHVLACSLLWRSHWRMCLILL